MAVTISGVTITTIQGSVNVDDAIGEPSTCSFEVYDPSGVMSFAKGEQVAVTLPNSSLKVFGGVIADATIRRISMGPGLRHAVTCKDWHHLADKRYAARAWRDMTAGAIVRELISIYLSVEGVTIGGTIGGGGGLVAGTPFRLRAATSRLRGTARLRGATMGTGAVVVAGSSIADGPLIKEMTVNYRPVSEAIDRLAELSDYWWRIDPDKRLWFQPRAARPAPWIFTGFDAHYEGDETTVRVRQGNPLYRNRQIILGALEVTDPQLEQRTGDGRTTTYTMPYALYTAPSVETSVDNGVTWTAETVGQQGEANQQNARWMWEPGENDITTSFSALATGVVIRFVYTGRYPIVIATTEPTAIAERQALEGGTGIIEAVERAENNPTRGMALQIAQAKLARYAVVGRTLTFDTLTPGLEPGHLLSATLPDRGVRTTPMLIQRIRTDIKPSGTWYSVAAVEGPDVSPWQSWKALTRAPSVVEDRVTLGESTTLVVQQSFAKNWTSAGAAINIWRTLNPSSSTQPGASTYPVFDARNRIVDLAWVSNGVEAGRRATTRTTVDTSTRVDTATFLGPGDANVQITALRWYGGANRNILIDEQAFVFSKDDLESLQIDRSDTRGY